MADLQALVAQAIQVKIGIIQEDPFEKGRRALLNLGHTFAHAIEHVAPEAAGHGEAVAVGLVAAANLSARLGHCDATLQARIEAMLAGVGLPSRVPSGVDRAALLRIMSSDKKRSAGRLRFVLLRAAGDVFLSETVPETAVLDTVTELSSGFSSE